jgi:large subunit ribosomal protein L11
MSSTKKGGTSATNSRPSLLKLTIPAGGAAPTPPVGPALGQKGVKAMDFCRQFNEASKIYQPGTPLRCEITVMPDRTFNFTVRPPATSWLLKRAANIEKASSTTTAANLNAKYIYEVAKVKAADPKLSHIPLRLLFRSVLAQARSVGIKVFL